MMKWNHITPKNLDDKELGYLFGFYEGDGYSVYDKNSRHYKVELFFNSIKDRDVQSKVMTMIKKTGLNASIIQDKRCNCSKIQIKSKEFKGFIEDRKNLPLTNEAKIGFISGVIDAEGWVVPKKSTIGIVNTDRELISLCKNFLDDLGIKCSVKERAMYERDRLPSYRILLSSQFNRLNHLSQKIRR